MESLNLMVNDMRKGYVLSKGQLKSYELLEIIVQFNTGSVRYKCLVGGVEEWLSEVPRTYESEEAFRKGDEYGAAEIKLRDVVGSAIPHWYCNRNNQTAFVYKDGKVRRVDVSELKYIYSDRKWRCSTECYSSEEELCRWRDITVTEEDGSTKILRSIAGLVAVKPEQQVIVDELKDALKRAEEAGLMVISDYECCELRVIDRSMIQEVALLYDGEETNEECEVEIDPAMMQKIYNISMYDYGGNQRFVARSRKQDSENN